MKYSQQVTQSVNPNHAHLERKLIMININNMVTQAKVARQNKINAYKAAKDHLQEEIDQISDPQIETILKPAINKIVNQVYLYNDNDSDRFVDKSTYINFQEVLEKLLSSEPLQDYYHATGELTKSHYTSKILQTKQSDYTEIIQLLVKRFTRYTNDYKLPVKFDATENKLEVTVDFNRL